MKFKYALCFLFLTIPSCSNISPNVKPQPPQPTPTPLPFVVVENGDLQGAIDSLSDGGGIFIPPGDILLSTPINMRDRSGITIFGSGDSSRVVALGDFTDKPIFDLTNASRCRFYNFFIRTSGDTRPSTAIILARNAARESAGQHAFRDMNFGGKFSQCTVYQLGSEVNDWSNCFFSALDDTPYTFVIATENRMGVTSPFGEVVGGSNACHLFTNCSFASYDLDSPGQVNLWIQDQANRITIENCLFSNRVQDMESLAGILIGHPDAWAKRVRSVRIIGGDFETEGSQNTIRIIGRVEGLTITDNELRARRSLIYANQAVYTLRLDSNRYLISGRDADPDWNVEGHRPRVLIENTQTMASELNFRMFWTQARLDREAPFTGYTKSIQFIGDSGSFGSKFWVNKTDDVVQAPTWKESPIEEVASFW